MIHHTACIGIFVIHANWPVERLSCHAKILTQSGKLGLMRFVMRRTGFLLQRGGFVCIAALLTVVGVNASAAIHIAGAA